jgi:light-regulated signal transduction histidine kinase (bacteriophytochrome)
LIDDLLAFSRVGRADIHHTSININEEIEQLKVELESEANNRTIIWNVENLNEAQGDRAMIRLVWQNLLSNALKYTRNCAEARIHIGSKNNEHETVFFVRDNGVGFDMRYVDKLFGVFQRLHHEEEFEGTGIGLANVQRIIRRHGGRVWAEGKINEGAVFYFSLPKVVAVEEATQWPN